MNSRSGQALVEFVLIAGILFSLFVATFVFGQWFLIHQKLIIAAREGAMVYSSGHFTREEVSRLMVQYLQRSPMALSPEGLQMYVGPASVGQARLFHLDEVRVSYAPTRFMSHYFNQRLEEKCLIKHAPHYGPPYQTFYGPAVPWGR